MLAFALLASALLASALLAFTPHATAAPISEELAVTGAVKTPLSLKLDELRAFPAGQIATVSVSRHVDGKDVVSTARGVRLTAVLERAGLLAADPNDWKHSVVLASATDGYSVVFSWPELFNGEAGVDVLVVFERDGQPLAEREGRIALVSGRDLKTGPRSVRWLKRLDVRVLKD